MVGSRKSIHKHTCKSNTVVCRSFGVWSKHTPVSCSGGIVPIELCKGVVRSRNLVGILQLQGARLRVGGKEKLGGMVLRC